MNANGIILAPVLPLWLIAIIFILGLILTFVQFRAIQDRLGMARSLLVSGLRAGTVCLIAVFAINPSLVNRKEHRISPAIAILVDTSGSMGQPAYQGKITRFDEARDFLTKGPRPLLGSLRQKYEVNVYGLDDSPRALEPGELEHLRASGNKADFNETLKALGENNSVAVLLSDGNLRRDESLKPQLPLITVPFGSPKTYRDVLIQGVRSPAIAFRGREVVIDVMIKSVGYLDLKLPVFLKDSEKLLAAKTVFVQTSPGEVKATLSFVPKELGRKNLSVSVPHQIGENLFGNNQIIVSIKVVRDKTRILMASGRPSLNYRFLRTAFKHDPSIDLLSFVILRTPSDILNVSSHELSLIPFPTETLFTKELDNFDLVIFDNFDYSRYLRPEYLERLRDFVKAGGGFAMIGGPNLFYEGENSPSPIGDILPFRFADKKFYRRDSPVRVRLGREGATHPIMGISDDFHDDDMDDARFWGEMPPLDGINLVDAKRSSAVLLESAEGIPWPILTVSDYEKGRVLALSTDYAWKWYMGMVAGGKGTQPYQRLVHRMVRWLTKDPSLDPIQILLPETSVPTGREVDVRFHVRGDDLYRRYDEAVSFSIFSPDGSKINSKLKPSPKPGEYLVSFIPHEGGIYRVKVETPVGLLEETMVVAGLLERIDAAPDHDLLKKIAASSGGKHISQKEDLLKEIEGYAQKAEKRFIEEKRLPMWTTPFVMAFILGLLSLEWYLRRRWGLI